MKIKCNIPFSNTSSAFERERLQEACNALIVLLQGARQTLTLPNGIDYSSVLQLFCENFTEYLHENSQALNTQAAKFYEQAKPVGINNLGLFSENIALNDQANAARPNQSISSTPKLSNPSSR